MKKLHYFVLVAICLPLLIACGSSNGEETNSESLSESDTPGVISAEEEKIVEETDVESDQEKIEVKTENAQVKTEVKSDKPSSISEQRARLVGTWLFTKASAGGSDRSANYLWGSLDGKPKKMTLLADGRIQYEQDVIDTLKMKKATWEIEKHATKDFYYFVTRRTADGVDEISKEKILTSTANKFIFGKRFTVEYTSSH